MTASFTETPEERRARYSRLAIAAAAAAARTQIPDVRTAYLLLAESWSNLAKGALLPGDEDLQESSHGEANSSGKPLETAKDVHT